MEELTRIYGEIKRLKKEITGIGIMRPGSISERYTVCGRKGCHCQDKEEPQKHGPYYHLSCTFEGKSYTEFIPKESLSMIKGHIKEYKKFRELCMELVTVNIELSQKLKEHKKKEKAGGLL